MDKIAKKKVKKTKTELKEQCFKLWSMLVRHREGNRCEICGVMGTSDRPLHAHHLISRNNLCFAFSVENGVCLCANHHEYSDVIAAHSSNYAGQEAWMRWVEKSKHGEWVKANKCNITHDTMYKSTYENIKEELISELSDLLELEGKQTLTSLQNKFKNKYYKYT